MPNLNPNKLTSTVAILDKNEVYQVSKIVHSPSFQTMNQQFIGRYVNKLRLKLKNLNKTSTVKKSSSEMDEMLESWNAEIRRVARPRIMAFGLVPYRVVPNPFKSYKDIKICDIQDIFTGGSIIFLMRDWSKTIPETKFYWRDTLLPNDHPRLRMLKNYPTSHRYNKDVYFFKIESMQPDLNGHLRSKLASLIHRHRRLRVYEELHETRETAKVRYPGYIEEQVPTSTEQIEVLERLRKMEVSNVAGVSNTMIEGSAVDSRIDDGDVTMFERDQPKNKPARSYQEIAGRQHLLKLMPTEKYNARTWHGSPLVISRN